MSLRRDERAVTVQIGAVLLLAIVFAALVLYQVNVVPAENGAVESEHNQNVHDEMQELRNAIWNAGMTENSQSASVTLGTRYPTRTFSVNPPNPTGTLETTGTATVSINATVVSEPGYEYRGNPDNLTGTHETTTLAYTPDYNEYRSAPTTRIEHGFAFNDFGESKVSLADQPLISNGTIRLVVLDGDFSRSGSGAITLDSTSLSGPSDPVPIEPEGNDEYVTVTIPTATPSAWNETIGTAFDEGKTGAKTSYNETDSLLTIELKSDRYDHLQLARVGVDNSGNPSSEFDVRKESTESPNDPTNRSAEYETKWIDSNPSSVSASESVELTMKATDSDSPVKHAPVSYAVRDEDDVIDDTTFNNSGSTDATGQHTMTFEWNSSAVAANGSTVTVYTSSGGSGDRIELRVEPSDDDSGPETDGIAWRITDETAYNVVQYSVSYDVNAGSFDHAQIEFHNRDRGTTTVENRSASRGTVEYSEGGSGGDSYTITITAFDTNGNVIDTRNETDTADGANPNADDDLSSSTSPRLNGSRVDDWSQPNDNSARYFVSYDVRNQDEFDRVEVRFKNRDSGAITAETATDPRGRLEFFGNSIDDEFGIELRVYDTDGVLVDSRSFGDTADGTNPTANDDLAASTSPQFQSVSVTDNGNNGQSRYTADYTVDSSSNLGTVWAEFRNLDNPWATEIAEQPDADGQFVHEPGGGTGGDAYEITLLIFDSDGAVVDRWDDNPG